MSIVYQFFEAVLNLLPDSPIQEWVEAFKGVSWLGYINFFIPISFMVNTTATWVGLLLTFRLIKIVVTFAKSLTKG